MKSAFVREIIAGRMRDGMWFCVKVWAITARVPMGKVATDACIARARGGSA